MINGSVLLTLSRTQKRFMDEILSTLEKILEQRKSAKAEKKKDGTKLSKDFDAAYRAKNPFPFASLEQVLDHIDHVVELIGIDYVGIGSDYDGVGDSLPTGLKDVSSYPNLVQGLMDRGYSDKDIKKILSGNMLRVWQQAEAYAKAH